MEENKKPLLSICIPTYNREKLLLECLTKIISQLEKKCLLNSVEIVISDNNSSDNTENLVKSFWNDCNIKYFKNNNNIWLNANVIKVTEHANWKYLWLLSDDDCITEFSLEYVLKIIEKESFDVMFCSVLSSENMDVKIEPKENKYEICDWINDFLSYIKDNYKWYKNLISFFSFYSILIVKAEYFRLWVSYLKEQINRNDFPHDMVVYHNLLNKKIIVPKNIFVIWRLLNESYVWSTKLIKSFNDCMNFIEQRNNLQKNSHRKYIKRICKNWRTKNILLWLIIGKLHINYKTNKFLKKIYYFYKKWIQ